MGKKKENRTYKDRRDYLIEAVSKRRKRPKELAIDEKGGKCQFCGYSVCNQALDFHHIDESTKFFGLSSRGLTHSWRKIKSEIDKCVLVCANCYREIHAGIKDLSMIAFD